MDLDATAHYHSPARHEGSRRRFPLVGVTAPYRLPTLVIGNNPVDYARVSTFLSWCLLWSPVVLPDGEVRIRWRKVVEAEAQETRIVRDRGCPARGNDSILTSMWVDLQRAFCVLRPFVAQGRRGILEPRPELPDTEAFCTKKMRTAKVIVAPLTGKFMKMLRNRDLCCGTALSIASHEISMSGRIECPFWLGTRPVAVDGLLSWARRLLKSAFVQLAAQPFRKNKKEYCILQLADEQPQRLLHIRAPSAFGV